MSTARGDRPVAPAPQRTVATPRTKTVGLSRHNRDYWYTHGCGLHMPQLGAPRNVQPLELRGSGSGVLEISIRKCDTKASGIAFLVGVEIALMLLSELALHMTMTEVSYIMSIIHAGDPQVFSHISTSQLAPPLFLSVFAIPMNEATDTSLRWLVILLFTFTIALNSCIVLVMTAYLSQHRKTPIMATRKLVERLIMWTVCAYLLIDANSTEACQLTPITATSMIAMIPQMLSFILVFRNDERIAITSDLDVYGPNLHESFCELSVINVE
ncbi:hypothetical protein EYR38_009123 [Pleurotus pulmonarius]|nr:hypothetical protein EYR38_009123 [Pleurotus pulmonarius]